jgi:hypothetical protein
MLARTNSRLLGGIVVVTLALSATAALAFPKDELFVIERTKNANFIRFEANRGKDGLLVEKEPVISYWVMAAENGRRENVRWLEKRAFGFSIKKKPGVADEYQMVLRAYKSQPISIHRQNGRWRAALPIDKKPAYLTRVFIATTGNAPIPHVDHVDVSGLDAVTEEPVRERIAGR